MDIYNSFFELVNRHGDREVGRWHLMESPIPVLSLTLLYLVIVKKFLPSYMKNKPPFNIQKWIILYNVLQVGMNIWLFYNLIPGAINSLKCHDKESSVRDGPPENTKTFTYYYHLSKYMDLLDTIFFILRKKDQVTTLHLYHHTTVPFWTWVDVKYGPDGRITFLAFINIFVHIVMYTYYMLSAMGPKFKKYLWWKRYVTILQLIQFVLGVLHTTQSVIFGCNVSRSLSIFNGIQSAVFFILFYDFYQSVYRKRLIIKETIGDSWEINSKKNKKMK